MFFFFFQAEDGIRDYKVTGVQTCALPILDIFCENIAFSVAQAERLFAAARAHGLPVKMHAEQLGNLGGTLMAARPGAPSCDHLEYARGREAAAPAPAGPAAVLPAAGPYCPRRR